MDFEKLADVIEGVFKNALEQKRYRFGLPQKKGISNKIASGNLKNSIEAIPVTDGIGIFMAPYGKWVQSGRLPGKYVPIRPLEKWIQDRNIKVKGMTTKQLAFAISNHIHSFGIPASDWMDVAIEELYTNKQIESILVDMTVDDLINKIEGI
jgi:hypothetical protein